MSADENVENRPTFSVVVPCYNERDGIGETVATLANDLQSSDEYEVIIVNDGSSDGTEKILEDIAQEYPQVRIITHNINRGYGAALKTGIRSANSDLIVITDADGTYPNERIPELVGIAQEKQLDMVVGSRTGKNVTYSKIRKIPKIFLKAYASWIARQNIPDINSGLRVMKKEVVQKFMSILPDSFSFTTTITVAMLTNNFAVHYEPISYTHRIGNSKIRPIRDTLLFFQLILRTGMYFAPLRVFFPVGAILFAAFLASLCFDVFYSRNLTDKTVLFVLFSMNTMMFALLADMIDKRSER